LCFKNIFTVSPKTMF